MIHRFLSLTLLSLGLAQAQKPDTAKNVHKLLADPNSDLAKAAQGMVGSKGGNQLFYFPTYDESSNPKVWGMAYENVSIPSTGGAKLHGWFLTAKGKTPKTAKGTIVFSHGNAGSLGHHIGFCAWFVQSGYNVLMYDYRGFGKSSGTVDRRGLVDDVGAAFQYARSRKDIDSNRLVSYGHSLGGAKSVTALGESPVKGVRAIIVDATFASYVSMANFVAGQLGESIVSDELAPKDYVKKLAPVPLLVIHGTKDEIVPISQGRQLFNAANEPKSFIEVKTAQHGNCLHCNGGANRKQVTAWLDTVLSE